MKKSTVIVTIILILITVGLVGTYAILTGMARSEVADSVMTPVEAALNRDLNNNYPATVKEVVKYYTEIEKCFYNEDCTDDQIDALGIQARELFDADLQERNPVGTYLMELKSGIEEFKSSKKRISAIAVAASTNVDYFSEDGYDFARIYCGYSVNEKGRSYAEGRVYLLRRDDNRHWKIYGWDNSNNVDPK